MASPLTKRQERTRNIAKIAIKRPGSGSEG